MEGKAARRLGVALVAAALLALQPSVARAAAEPTETLHVLVHFAPGTSTAERVSTVREVGGTIEGEIPAIGVTRVAITIERGSDPASVLRALAAHRDVKVAEPDARVHLDWTPNDPYWSTDPYVGLGQWGDKEIALDKARDMTGALQQVIVAVIDTGVDAGHPDLAGVVLPGVTILSAQSSGCAADAIATDDNSHGTHVAGIIAADANNGIGIAGVAPNARILPIKALDCTGSGSESDIAQAITYAVDHGARVINISLGSSSDSATLEAAVQYATAHNVLIVAAVGNCGASAANSSRCLYTANLAEYPGASPGVLGVGATSTDDSIATFSTQGPQVAVSAPGVRIVSTTPRYPTYQSARGTTLSYAAFSGTSQATPFVAGAAALLLGIDPTLTAQLVADRLKTSADDLGVPGTDVAYGAGRIDLARAVTATLPTFSAKYDTSFTTRAATSGSRYVAKVAVTNTSQATWPASGSTPVRLSYHWADATGATVVWDGVRTDLPADLPAGATIAVNMNIVAPPTSGTYTLRIDLVRDGVAWFSQRGVPTGDVVVAVGSGLGATYATAATTATFFTAAPAPLSVTLTNTGTQPWLAGGPQPVHLSYHWIRGDGTVAVWDGLRAPPFASDVLAGQSTTVQLPVAAPPALGAYTLRLDLVQEGVAWFSGQGIAPRDIAYLVTTGYAATYVVPPSIPALLPGERTSVKVGLTNTGAVAWASGGTNPVHLAAHVVDGTNAISIWDGQRTSFADDIAPGISGTFSVAVDAPLAPGAYRARFDLVREGIAWFSSLGIAPADLGFSVVSDYRASLPSGPLSVSRSAPATTITITNTSGAVWTASGPAPVHVSVHWYDASGAVLVWDGARTSLPRDVAPGESVSLSVALGTPPTAASSLAIDLVSEGVRWFGAGTTRPVTLLP